MFKQKTDYLLLVFICIMMFISLRYGNTLVDWWDALVNGKAMNHVSILYLIALTGTVICVFMRYYKAK